MSAPITWEQAVEWLRAQPSQQSLVRACYYDDPLIEAARRFEKSAEWQSVCRRLGVVNAAPGKALDVGAGRGISSFALARAGWQVTALEPDPSPLVGAQAIRSLAEQAGLSIRVVEEFGERLPFEAGSFDLVYGREVLHHARNLQAFCQEIGRVLKPGGYLLATREHVISRLEDLPRFLESHPLHALYGGENAYLLHQYTAALAGAGLRIVTSLSPLDSVINTFPMDASQDQGWRAGLRRGRAWLAGRLPADLARKLFKTLDTPGRLYTFIAIKA